MFALALCLFAAPAVPAAAADPEFVYYVFAGNDLTDLRKELDGPPPKDSALANALKTGEGVTSLVVRATKVDGKTTELHVYTTRVKQPKIEPVRNKPFAPTDDDGKRLMKAVKLTE